MSHKQPHKTIEALQINSGGFSLLTLHLLLIFSMVLTSGHIASKPATALTKGTVCKTD